MGIRMSKAVGWGLKLKGLDLSVLNNFEKLESKDRYDCWYSESLASAEERKDLAEKMVLKTQTQKCNGLYDMLVYDREFGFDDKVLFVPFGYRDIWRRYGNLLDVFEYEATREWDSPNWMVPEWHEKAGTLHPFVGLMKPNTNYTHGIEEYWETCYLDKEEYKDAIPKAPRHLWYLIKHLGLVPEDRVTEVFLTLRPSVYIYWC